MKIACASVLDFLHNLRMEKSVLHKAVYIDISERPVGEDKWKAVKFQIFFQAAAVIDWGEDGQYALVVGEDCGMDYRDSTKEAAGTERAVELRELIQKHCEELGLTVRPGLLEL